jgi:hypothetical protein
MASLKIEDPFKVTAIPRDYQQIRDSRIRAAAHNGLKPVPGISYLAQSPAYYEMLDNRRKQKLRRGIPTMTTRRMITENRISSNIMAYN